MTKPKIDENGDRVPRGKYFADKWQEFGRWQVIDATRVSANGDVKVLCRCSCGVERPVSLYKLNKGISKSCGCLAAELSALREIKHGGSYTADYGIWRGMLKRCGDPKYSLYHLYGSRGITVCDRWLDFVNFISDMGYRPDKSLSIERRDNDGPYAPWNCYWATSLEQNNNTRGCRRIEFRGEVKTQSQWARHCGIEPATLRARLRSGWAFEDAITIVPGSVQNLRNGGYKLLNRGKNNG